MPVVSTGLSLQRLRVRLLLRALLLVSNIKRNQNENGSHHLHQQRLMGTEIMFPIASPLSTQTSPAVVEDCWNHHRHQCFSCCLASERALLRLICDQFYARLPLRNVTEQLIKDQHMGLINVASLNDRRSSTLPL